MKSRTYFLCILCSALSISLTAQEKKDSLDVYNMSLEELLNMKISVATKSESSLDESPGIVTVIDRKLIETTGAKSLVDIMRMIPGFDYSRVSIGWGESLDEFYARGIPSDFSQTILFLLNGRNKFNDLTYASPWMSQRINVDMIDRIEVIRGPGSALYGGNAFSAVINIITRDTNLTPESIFTVRAGQYGSFSAHALSKFKLSKSGWFMGVQGKYMSEQGATYDVLKQDRWYNGQPIPQSSKVTDGLNPSYDVSLNVTSPDKKIRAQYWRTDHNPHPFMTGFYPVPNNGNYKYQVTQDMVNLDYKPVKNLTVAAYYSRMYWDWRTIAYDTTIRTSNNQYQQNDISGSRQNNDNYMLEANYNFNLDNHNVLAGVSFNSESQFKPGTLYFDAVQGKEIMDPSQDLAYQYFTRKQYSLYLQDNYKLSSTISLTAGVRYDNFRDLKNPNVVNPRGAFVWNFYKKGRIKVLYGEAFRPPSGAELKGGSALLVKSNPNIEPEKLRTVEVAYIGYLKFARLQISAYKNATRKTILTNQNLQYQNLGNIGSEGVELELQGKFWWLNYTHIKSELTSTDASTGQSMKSDVNFLAFNHFNAGINYALKEKISFSVQAFYRSPRKTPTGEKVQQHFETDFLTKYTWKNIDFVIGARNLFNYSFEFPVNDGGYYKYPYRGREVYIRVSLKI